MAWIEIICGPMFSGKSEELIRKLHLALHAGKTILVLKPKKDTLHKQEIASRKKKSKNDKDFEKFSSFPAHNVETANEAQELLELFKPDILAIDEGQFLDISFEKFIKDLKKNIKHQKLIVMISGLDMTSEFEPFGSMPQFMAMSNETQKLRAVCFKCRSWPPSAEMTYFKGGKKSSVVYIDDGESYEALCSDCWSLTNEMTPE